MAYTAMTLISRKRTDPMLRFLTAGESHGPSLIALLEGMPAGVPISRAPIDEQLHRRQGGYGRGGRMKIEHDQVDFLSGVRHGHTLGSPIALRIENRDWANWQDRMGADPRRAAARGRHPRPPRPRRPHRLPQIRPRRRARVPSSAPAPARPPPASPPVPSAASSSKPSASSSTATSSPSAASATPKQSAPTPAPSIRPSGIASTPPRCAAPIPTSPPA